MTDTHPISHSRRDIAGDVTAKILAALSQGVMPWRKPWDGARTGGALPRRATGEAYRGVNVIMLWHAAAVFGYRSPYWLSFNQAMKFGAHVRKGERGELVVYHGQALRTKRDTTGAEIENSFRFLKAYVAFNADQIEGLPERFHPAALDQAPLPLEAHEAWFSKLDIARIQSRDIACYVPSRDVIAMPPLAAFDTTESYAATLNHEAVHATGASHRVDRDLSRRFSNEMLAVEELIAEIGAAILGAHLRLPPAHIVDHSAYIGHWMQILQNDKRAFLFAAAQAQAAVDWLLAKSPAPGFADTGQTEDD